MFDELNSREVFKIPGIKVSVTLFIVFLVAIIVFSLVSTTEKQSPVIFDMETMECNSDTFKMVDKEGTVVYATKNEDIENNYIAGHYVVKSMLIDKNLWRISVTNYEKELTEKRINLIIKLAAKTYEKFLLSNFSVDGKNIVFNLDNDLIKSCEWTGSLNSLKVNGLFELTKFNKVIENPLDYSSYILSNGNEVYRNKKDKNIFLSKDYIYKIKVFKDINSISKK